MLSPIRILIWILSPDADLNVYADDYDNDARNSWGVVPLSFLAGKTPVHSFLSLCP